jgi:hypothetical protein
MSLPPSFRNKVHIGLHVATFCEGSKASLQLFAEELLNLWENPIVVDNVTYYVMVAQILMDGPGRAKFCRCSTAASYAGCPLCDVEGKFLHLLAFSEYFVTLDVKCDTFVSLCVK